MCNIPIMGCCFTFGHVKSHRVLVHFFNSYGANVSQPRFQAAPLHSYHYHFKDDVYGIEFPKPEVCKDLFSEVEAKYVILLLSAKP